MKKINILIVGFSTNIGGIENYLFNLIDYADNKKFNFFVLSLDKEVKIAFEEELKNNNVNIIKINSRKKNYLKYLHDVKKLFKYSKFDYIHFNLMDLSCFELIYFANKYRNGKIIIHSHNNGNEYFKCKHFRTKLLHNMGRIVMANCNCLKASCSEDSGKFMFGSDKFTVFNNGIDYNRFEYNDKNRKEIRQELNISDNTFLIGYVAALLPIKNHKFLIDIFNNYIKKNSNTNLILVGDGELKNELINYAKKLNIFDKIIFLGARNDCDKIYSALDLFVMPSISESLGMVLCEAQINGLKCIASNGVSKDSKISNNIVYLPLAYTSKEWSDFIMDYDKSRDFDILKCISKKYSAKENYDKVYEFYIENN